MSATSLRALRALQNDMQSFPCAYTSRTPIEAFLAHSRFWRACLMDEPTR